MFNKVIYITENDIKRLRELIMVAREFGKEEEKYLSELEKELNRGKIVQSQDIPHDVITMNSKVHLKNLDTNEEIIYQLVFPDDANADQGRISILAPIGTALLGYSVGNVIEWKVPSGVAKLKVERILYQPEAAGDYSL
ncbi:MAG: nucleoside diphosphate kinase regulator [Candidatus Omnitrophica bacterium]|jgi:regulator of nucleoside diphosphate kinase|nr:nucleoside diphosphate kinase regulator [Candidatus Omnitrophota bacterium]